MYDPTPGTSFPRGKTYSARKFTPIQSAPASWGLKFRQRMVPIAPAINLEVQNGMPITLSPTDVDDDAIPSGPTTINAVWEPVKIGRVSPLRTLAPLARNIRRVNMRKVAVVPYLSQ